MDWYPGRAEPMPARSTWLLAAAPVAAVAVGVFAEGGYSPGARIAFGIAALASSVVVLAARRARLTPVV
ncbi:MAG: hypothetical protein QOG63_2349, partial [Thermoleophilaceae bacterium]|nr:hypothetical protein [Thermoleophilaceae bacterium]